MRGIVVLACISFLLWAAGCANQGVNDTVAQQQQLINEMDAKLKTNDARLSQLQSEMNELRKEVDRMKQIVQKVRPGYVEGNVQEGNQ